MTPAIDQLSAALAAGEDCRFALHDAYLEAGYPMQAEAVMALAVPRLRKPRWSDYTSPLASITLEELQERLRVAGNWVQFQPPLEIRIATFTPSDADFYVGLAEGEGGDGSIDEVTITDAMVASKATPDAQPR